MGVNPVVRALRNSVLKGAAGRRPADALARGVEAAGQVGASASEFLRVRRDPAEAAVRRRKAAVRRANIWGAGAVVGVAGGAALTIGIVNDGVTASAVFSFILVAALVIWCLLGVIRSVRDVRARSRVLAALPPPQPGRRPVAAPIRGEIAHLDSYSDRLRQLVPMLDQRSGSTDLGREVIAAADTAEVVLRRQAQEFTGVRKAASAGPGSARARLDASSGELAGRIRAGVQEYGRLVAAAAETVAASAQLDVAATGLSGPTDRLEALTVGMQEIALHARPGGPS
ncbi:hypothetical protein ABIB25_003999 [Nakamurella sp. UYEF19]|uniref:phage shock envelope stress response protein PspM n=1 Tax=Nakamurella sp. UYEF19 TaxID=1756392 RepID=UPI003398D0F7